MKNLSRVVLLLLVCFAAPGFGADGNELSAKQSIRINATPEAVWAVLGDFNGTPRWLPLVTHSQIVFGTNNRVGAIRLVTRRNGTKVTERLLDRDPQNMRMAYTYVDGAVMATDYSPVLSVKDAGDGTSVVEWSARFKPLAYSGDAPSAEDERALSGFFDGVYKTGLENLKRVVENGE
jgi:mxaD protein